MGRREVLSLGYIGVTLVLVIVSAVYLIAAIMSDDMSTWTYLAIAQTTASVALILVGLGLYHMK